MLEAVLIANMLLDEAKQHRDDDNVRCLPTEIFMPLLKADPNVEVAFSATTDLTFLLEVVSQSRTKPMGRRCVWGGYHLHPDAPSRVPEMTRLEFCRRIGICLASGVEGRVEAAHIRSDAPLFSKADAGIGLKPSDVWTVPLHPEHHRIQHSMSEAAFWRKSGYELHSSTSSPLTVAAVITAFHKLKDVEAARMYVRQRAAEAASLRHFNQAIGGR